MAKNKAKLINETKARTGEVQCSYPHLLTPYAAEEDQKAKYSMCLLIPKTEADTIDVITKAIENAKKKGLETQSWKPAVLQNPKFHEPLRDGDADKPDKPEFAGMYFVNAKSDKKPLVIDGAKNKIEDPDEVYAGCWVSASITFYPFDVKGNKGIACALNGVMKLRDDEPIAGGASANDWEAEEDSEDEDDFLN